MDEDVPFEIDQEFATLLPQSSVEERAALKDQMIAAGRCLEPYEVWEDHPNHWLLVDGHTRNELNQDLHLPVKLVRLHARDREEVKRRILLKQFGRRNINPLTRAYIRGTLYDAEKCQGQRTDTSGQNVQKLSTGERLADAFKVNEKTIRRDAAFKSALDQLHGKAGNNFRNQVLSGELLLTRVAVEEIAAMNPVDQSVALARLLQEKRWVKPRSTPLAQRVEMEDAEDEPEDDRSDEDQTGEFAGREDDLDDEEDIQDRNGLPEVAEDGDDYDESHEEGEDDQGEIDEDQDETDEDDESGAGEDDVDECSFEELDYEWQRANEDERRAFMNQILKDLETEEMVRGLLDCSCHD